jgi:hypothetical protein
VKESGLIGDAKRPEVVRLVLETFLLIAFCRSVNNLKLLT